MQKSTGTRLNNLIDRGEHVTGKSVKTALCLAYRDFNPALHLYATGVDERERCRRQRVALLRYRSTVRQRRLPYPGCTHRRVRAGGHRTRFSTISKSFSWLVQTPG